MLIYSPYNSPRFRYACSILLENYVGEWSTTSDKSVFETYSGAKIYYGFQQEVKDAIFIPVTDVLWNEKIIPHDIMQGYWKDIPTLYPGKGDIHFDIFSAIFFLISRYEEYLPFEGDKMGRFAAANSIAFKYGFLRRPVIDLWRKAFENEIVQRWPQTIFRKNEFRFLSTIDVDSAFTYRHKGFKRTFGGMAKDIFRFDIPNFIERIKTLLRLQPDSYDTYHYIAEQTQKNGIENRYFFLLADFGRFDKNVPHTSVNLQNLIKEINSKYSAGIHPGVASNKSIEILKQEKQRLEKITGQTCIAARQHYLSLRFPVTYQSYIEANIREDYTMGFADDVGFRAGTSRPFLWFDLEKNEITHLRVFPFAIMDTTLNNYLRLSPNDAIKLSEKIIKEVHLASGNFIALWHNETLSETGNWKGWRKVWEATLRLGSQQ